MEKIERNSYYFLANKADIPSINKRGFKKSDEQIRISDETIYLTTNRLNAQEAPLISPNELEVVLLRHQETKKLTDKAQLVSVALEYQKLFVFHLYILGINYLHCYMGLSLCVRQRDGYMALQHPIGA